MRSFEYVVVGGGIAGLSAVIRLAEAVALAGAGSGKVLLVTKESLAESNTSYAQGGIAVAMGGKEDIALHFKDTLAAGDGLVNVEAAGFLVGDGPARVEKLVAMGAEFDRDAQGELLRTREGAHSLSRILHAQGDATGKEIARALVEVVKGLKNVEFLEWTTAVELLVEEGRVVGAALLRADGELEEVKGKAVLLASGGAGQVYRETTNPAVATGDGIAMAYRAGAALEDMEFYQFHPTAFAMAGAPRFLLSEALRGEGALLKNAQGERFMVGQHAQAELAPRDVVARAITREAVKGAVYLDMRGVTGVDLRARFPGISKFLDGYGLELGRDLIPVLPAAHYLMGGIKTDRGGRTTLQGLYAAGEAACTGVHGANRLASNSLLEGLVFGVATAETMLAEDAGRVVGEVVSGKAPQGSVEDVAATEAWIAKLREVMWVDAGLLRDKAGLLQAQGTLDGMFRTMPRAMTRRSAEARNLYTVAGVMVESALGREESRGAHYRNDYPERGRVAEHSVMEKGRLTFLGNRELVPA